MSAYAIFICDKTTGPEEMQAYRAKAAAVGGERTLLAGGAGECVEGPVAESVMLLEFPSMADARAWYSSPAYQEASQHRLKGAEYRVIFIDGK